MKHNILREAFTMHFTKPAPNFLTEAAEKRIASKKVPGITFILRGQTPRQKVAIAHTNSGKYAYEEKLWPVADVPEFMAAAEDALGSVNWDVPIEGLDIPAAQEAVQTLKSMLKVDSSFVQVKGGAVTGKMAADAWAAKLAGSAARAEAMKELPSAVPGIKYFYNSKGRFSAFEIKHGPSDILILKLAAKPSAAKLLAKDADDILRASGVNWEDSAEVLGKDKDAHDAQLELKRKLAKYGHEWR